MEHYSGTVLLKAGFELDPPHGSGRLINQAVRRPPTGIAWLLRAALNSTHYAQGAEGATYAPKVRWGKRATRGASGICDLTERGICAPNRSVLV